MDFVSLNLLCRAVFSNFDMHRCSKLNEYINLKSKKQSLLTFYAD